MENVTQSGLIFALFGGILPAFFWLKFWLKSDTHSEPRGLIFKAFLMGAIITLVALLFENLSQNFLGETGIILVIVWAALEELLKFGGAYLVAIRTRFCDEPIDPSVYLISTALGFAAFENFIFILGSLYHNKFIDSFVTANLRFIGPTLLHVVCSCLIGISIGYGFYKKDWIKKILLISGIFGSILLHAAFNSFIISEKVHPLIIFTGVWIGVILTILILEKIKKIKNVI